MKRIITFALALTMLLVATLSFTSCGQTDDWKTVQERGYFYCGITVYAPMNYYDDETGDLIGFDTELAKAVFTNMGYDVMFQLIDWSARYTRLVVEATLGGEVMYYPVSLPEVLPNSAYEVTLRVTRRGSPDPDIPVTGVAAEFKVDVQDWIQRDRIEEVI